MAPRQTLAAAPPPRPRELGPVVGLQQLQRRHMELWRYLTDVRLARGRPRARIVGERRRERILDLALGRAVLVLNGLGLQTRAQCEYRPCENAWWYMGDSEEVVSTRIVAMK